MSPVSFSADYPIIRSKNENNQHFQAFSSRQPPYGTTLKGIRDRTIPASRNEMSRRFDFPDFPLLPRKPRRQNALTKNIYTVRH
jgi:hypothetical protein